MALFDDIGNYLYRIRVSALSVCFLYDVAGVNHCVGGQFTRNRNQAVAAHCFDGGPGVCILLKAGIQDGIRNLVAYLVRVAN